MPSFLFYQNSIATVSTVTISAIILGYLLSLRARTDGGRWITILFACTLLFNFSWFLASSIAGRLMIFFIPPQYFFAFLASAASLQFALRFPKITSRTFIRFANFISGLFGVIILTCLLWFYLEWLTSEARLSIALLIPSLLILVINLLILAAFMMQIHRLSRESAANPSLRFLQNLLQPVGNSAKQARIHLLFYAIIIVLNLANVVRGLGRLDELIYYLIFSNGMIVALTGFSLVFLNSVQKPVSFNSKLILAVLMFALLITNMISPIVSQQRELLYHMLREKDVSILENHIEEGLPFMNNELYPDVSYIARYPVHAGRQVAKLEMLYPGDGGSFWEAGPQRPASRFDMLKALQDGEISFGNWYYADRSGNLFQDDPFPITRFIVSTLVYDGYVYEIGKDYFAYRQFLHESARPLVILTLLAPGIVLLLFPMLFRGVLIQPLNNLLSGLSAVKEGQLNTYVPVRYQDEIGYLTASFNEMIQSIRQQTDQLREYNELLEEKVRLRTDELREAMQTAERSNAAKSAFLANMSHEVRTPLTAIIGYSEMLFEDMIIDGREFEAQDLRRIRQSALLLLNIINDILDLSRIESGKLALNYEEVQLDYLLLNLQEMVEPLIEKNDNQLLVDNHTEGFILYTDRQRLTQCLLNLLGNAAKFTQQGTIRIISEIDEDEKGISWLCLRIQDSGVGIEAEELEKIFEPFEQARSNDRLKFSGTGLGLAITRRFCDMLGGRVVAESVVDEGSTFTIQLPLDTIREISIEKLEAGHEQNRDLRISPDQ